MPLRDHFRPPVYNIASWEGFHALWPGAMVFQLARKLPPGFVAEPRVHLGTYFELDISTFEGVSVATSSRRPIQPMAAAAVLRRPSRPSRP
jgi:hypothetical protein